MLNNFESKIHFVNQIYVSINNRKYSKQRKYANFYDIIDSQR